MRRLPDAVVWQRVPGVYLAVPRQLVGPRKATGAAGMLTTKRPFTSVRAHVCGEMV